MHQVVRAQNWRARRVAHIRRRVVIRVAHANDVDVREVFPEHRVLIRAGLRRSSLRMRKAPGCSQESEREEQQEESGTYFRKANSCGHEASAVRHQRHAFNLKTHQSGTTVKCIHLRQEFYWLRGTTAPTG